MSKGLVAKRRQHVKFRISLFLWCQFLVSCPVTSSKKREIGTKETRNPRSGRGNAASSLGQRVIPFLTIWRLVDFILNFSLLRRRFLVCWPQETGNRHPSLQLIRKNMLIPPLAYQLYVKTRAKHILVPPLVCSLVRDRAVTWTTTPAIGATNNHNSYQ